MRRKKLRPWVKTSLAFLIGVFITAQIFSITGSLASTGEEKNIEVIHGMISINRGGESYIKPIDGAYEIHMKVDTRDNYYPMQIITLVLDGEKISEHYITEGEELERLMNSHRKTIEIYQNGIMESIYE